MNLGTPSSAIEMLTELKRLVKDISDVEVFIAPPFTAIATVVDFLKDTNLNIGAQNMYYEEYGAFTGEISPIFLKEMGVTHIIIGHSERRTLFNETDELNTNHVNSYIRSRLILPRRTVYEWDNEESVDFDELYISRIPSDDPIRKLMSIGRHHENK